ncbi:MAG: AmmeMemoRadiSam system protein B [bacterium]|nr:AmmeMemoRadiSam system protein B [bacterium]
MIKRKCVHAGRFYPDDKDTLKGMFDSFKERIEKRDLKNALPFGVVPHAGYLYSGFTAMHFYLEAARINIERIVIIGPSHRHLFAGFALSDTIAWESPLGDVPVDIKFSKLLVSENVTFSNKIHSEEHSIEVQIPFIKYAFKNEIKIVPVIMGRQEAPSAQSFASLLTEEMMKNTLIIASSDLHHGYDYEEAKISDQNTIKEILKNDFKGFMKYFQNAETDGVCAACGGGPLGIVLFGVKSRKGRLLLLHHTTSADVTQDYDGYTVGYSSFIGVKDEERK